MDSSDIEGGIDFPFTKVLLDTNDMLPEFLLRIFMSLSLLLIYGTFALTVLCSYGNRLDTSAKMTIFVYLSCILTKIGYTIYDVSTIGIANPHGIMIPNQAANVAIITVFYYFTYELRIVQLKLECSTFT